MPSTNPEIRHILILKADRLCAEALRLAVRRTFPKAAVASAGSIAEARHRLEHVPCDLLVSGVTLPDGNLLELLTPRFGYTGATCRLLVVTSDPSMRLIRRLRNRPGAGVFDTAVEDPEDLSFFLLNVALGLPCWSMRLLERPVVRPAVAATRVSRTNGHAAVA